MDIHELVNIEANIRYKSGPELLTDLGYVLDVTPYGDEIWSKQQDCMDIPARKFIRFYKNSAIDEKPDWQVEVLWQDERRNSHTFSPIGLDYQEVRYVTRRMYELLAHDYAEQNKKEREEDEQGS